MKAIICSERKKSRELSSIGRTLHYVCSGSWFEPRSSYLSTLNVVFIATRLLDKKSERKENNNFIKSLNVAKNGH
jgi:hypothetical protein